MASMTEDQAVAWLLLEGYVVTADRGNLRWMLPDEVPRYYPTKWNDERPVMMGGASWRFSEFRDEETFDVGSYPQYAPAVVKLLTEKENEP